MLQVCPHFVRKGLGGLLQLCSREGSQTGLLFLLLFLLLLLSRWLLFLLLNDARINFLPSISDFWTTACNNTKINLLLSLTCIYSEASVRRCSSKYLFLKISQENTWKHVCWILLLIDPQACNFIKKRLHHSCFPVNIVNFLKTPFSQNTSGRLLLFFLAVTAIAPARDFHSKLITLINCTWNTTRLSFRKVKLRKLIMDCIFCLHWQLYLQCSLVWYFWIKWNNEWVQKAKTCIINICYVMFSRIFSMQFLGNLRVAKTRLLSGDHSFSAYAKFCKKLTFLTHVCVRIRG